MWNLAIFSLLILFPMNFGIPIPNGQIGRFYFLLYFYRLFRFYLKTVLNFKILGIFKFKFSKNKFNFKGIIKVPRYLQM